MTTEGETDEHSQRPDPLALAGSLLAFAGCSGNKEASDRAVHFEAAVAASSGTTSTPSPEPDDDPLAGTYRSGTMSLTKMAKVAKAAGFKTPDIRDYLSENFGHAKSLVYMLKFVDGRWVAFVEIDGSSAEETWSGRYQVVDGSTVEAGAPPCGPITYGYALSGDG